MINSPPDSSVVTLSNTSRPNSPSLASESHGRVKDEIVEISRAKEEVGRLDALLDHRLHAEAASADMPQLCVSVGSGAIHC